MFARVDAPPSFVAEHRRIRRGAPADGVGLDWIERRHRHHRRHFGQRHAGNLASELIQQVDCVRDDHCHRSSCSFSERHRWTEYRRSERSQGSDADTADSVQPKFRGGLGRSSLHRLDLRISEHVAPRRTTKQPGGHAAHEPIQSGGARYRRQRTRRQDDRSRMAPAVSFSVFDGLLGMCRLGGAADGRIASL